MRLHVGEVRHPEPVRRWRPELPLHEVTRPALTLVGMRRHLVGPTPAHAGEAELPHQALDRAAGDTGALPVELGPDFVGPVDVEVLGMDAGDLAPELPVADGPSRRSSFLRHPVGVRGDPAAVLSQHRTDRLDPETVAVGVDVGDYLSDRRSSSAPKKAAADLRISEINR